MKAVSPWRKSPGSMSRSPLFFIFHLSLLLMVVSETAHACSVCFGNAEGEIIDALNFSIIFMLGITYLILAVFIFLFIKLRRRERLFTSTPEHSSEDNDNRQTSPAY